MTSALQFESARIPPYGGGFGADPQKRLASARVLALTLLHDSCFGTTGVKPVGIPDET